MSFLVQGVKQKQVNWKYYNYTQLHTNTREIRAPVFRFFPQK